MTIEVLNKLNIYADAFNRIRDVMNEREQIRKQSKVRNQSKQTITKPSSETDKGILELQRQYEV